MESGQDHLLSVEVSNSTMKLVYSTILGQLEIYTRANCGSLGGTVAIFMQNLRKAPLCLTCTCTIHCICVIL